LNVSKSIANNSRQIFILAIAVLLIKLVLLPFAQTVDSDAVSRVHLSMDWLQNPRWIDTSVWAPFHFYLNGFFLGIWNDTVLAPKVLNIVISCLSLLPLYYFTRREFNEKGALIVAIFFAISPILFRNNFMALSETPYLLFLLLAMNLISKSIREDKWQWMLVAGLMITIASGFRYEAWLLMFFMGALLLFVDWKKAFLFGAMALLFPLIWLYSNWVETGDAFYSIQGNYRWTLEMMGNNDGVNGEILLHRVWFFPFSWLISVGPPVAFLVLVAMVRNIKKFRVDKLKSVWAILFFTMLLFFIYNAYNGVLLLQHRFIGTLVVLSLPFIALYFNEWNSKTKRNAIIYGTLIVGLSFVYNQDSISPLPRLGDQNKAAFSESINESLSDDGLLILDFVGWDYTYYYALQSRLPMHRIILMQGAKNSEIPASLKEKVLKMKSGVFVLGNESGFRNEILAILGSQNLKKIESCDEFEVYSYKSN
jgi:4-amino-4-deoxy-L-arabinose transferase-like glycosyltransferase